MGGMGSGRCRRNMAEHGLRRLEVAAWQRAGALEYSARTRWQWATPKGIAAVAHSMSEEGRLTLHYSSLQAGRWYKKMLVVKVEWSPCNYGGRRPWFLCPVEGCSRRATVLYGVEDFRCRRCCKMSYESQRVAPQDRALWRAQHLRERMGASVNVSLPLPPKPKGMHSWTYTKLCIRVLAAELRAAGEVHRALDRSRACHESA